jgi:hypothetical protein
LIELDSFIFFQIELLKEKIISKEKELELISDIKKHQKRLEYIQGERVKIRANEKKIRERIF